MPLLQNMQFSGVTYTNGPHEYGKDVIAWEADELLHRSWLAVVAKASTLNAKSKATNDSASTVTIQIRKAFVKAVHVPPTGDPVFVERVWVMTSGDIPPEALNSVEGDLEDRYKQRARWVDGGLLVDLNDRYRVRTWNELLSTEESDAD